MLEENDRSEAVLRKEWKRRRQRAKPGIRSRRYPNSKMSSRTEVDATTDTITKETVSSKDNKGRNNVKTG